MVKLSDYMDYLNEEIVQARKKADEQAVIIAKEYAKHPYLKYFRVPRFTMPSVKLSIPIKISELDSDTSYKFEMDDNQFLKDVNTKIELVNKEKNLKLVPINKNTLKGDNLKSVIADLKKGNTKPITKPNDNLLKVDLKKPVLDLIKIRNFNVSADVASVENAELEKILKESLANRYKPISSKLNNIYFDPNTSDEKDKGKILLTLNVEMVEEGIRIHNAKDEKGNKIEEIIFE
ncbi:hypothetical protein GCM10022291_05870 [Postechiella marina]|uniref:Uncharacterized protein n=2 Tax=Postechiella marina TaxID=943941 RepID=A0ABP8C1W2_9FLAO